MIEDGHVFETPSYGKVKVNVDWMGNYILHLSGCEKHAASFNVEDIKAFRKFLKKLQRQLEGNDKDDFGGVSI